jgi:nitrogen-specific signal transduction histidine kinase/ActR/RegA family two-component response regulator
VGLVLVVTERRHLQEQLQQSQKMEAIGRLAGGIAHDFNNLLTAILGYARFALNRLPAGDPIAADVTEIHRAGERAAMLTQQLLAYSRRQMLQPTVLDMNETVTNLVSLLGRLLGEHIELVLTLRPGSGAILADRASLEQVVVNLAVNARDAMPTGGRLTIATEPVELGSVRPEPLAHLTPGTYVRLSVSDTGHGMDAETMAQVFEPFFTTKEVGKGTGLGLAMVFGTVSQSGGGVTVASAPGQGASFSLYFPQAVAPTLGAPAILPPVAGGRETILLVEDEPAVLELAARGLTERGYTVVATSAPTQAEAWATSRERDGKRPADLLITDVVMPEMSGPELAERLAERWPDLRVLFVSGYTDDAVVAHGLIESTVDFLPKPFPQDELARRVRRALDQPTPRTSRTLRAAVE